MLTCSRETDDNALIPFASATASSNGLVTCEAIISALAPGYTVVTITVGDSVTGYSRVPLYRGSKDRIIGMVHVFDLFRLSSEERPRPRPVVFAPPSTPCDDLLLEMKRRRCHLAIVVRAGRAVGMVTMEDLVEELVGEIRDEHDKRASFEDDPGAIVVDGYRSIAEINAEYGLNLPSDGARTIAELVAARFDRPPRPGDSIRSDRLTIEVIDSTPQRIRRIRLRRDH